MRKLLSFPVTVEAEIIKDHRSWNELNLCWRAIVRIGGHMEWHWFGTRKEAVSWVKTWRDRGKTLVEVLSKP